MIYISAPDLHFSPETLDVNRMCGDAVFLAAERYQPEFIALPGDLFHKALFATDKAGYNELRRIIQSWAEVCEILAIYGTPSHEPAGSLDSLSDCGLTVLRPNRVIVKNDYIVFGVPELNKQSILSTLTLSSENANAEIENLFRRYLKEFVAPTRLKHADKIAIMLLHGYVSDSKRENTEDMILKASDILLHTEDFKDAGIDRLELGHLHKPWESEVMSAGYAGSWGITWGETGFLPAMNLVEIKMPGDKPIVTRIPYGTPERRKIFVPLKTYDDTIAYWLHSTDPKAKVPNGHPWSRVTYDAERKESRRVTADQAAKVKTLKDLFKLIDPDVTQSQLAKVDTIETSQGAIIKNAIDVTVDTVSVWGSVFWQGKKLELDIKSQPAGLTALLGDNGSGKSATLAFCTPYPVIVGKDTRSGRESAIKDFFDSRDSGIEKLLTVNGVQHRHLITIKGAHTQTPKVECYLYIDGISKLEKATWDTMFEECEKLYGPYTDYLLTTFYVQPLQGKTGSSLMSATMTDVRNLVQSIAGIDREKESRFALDKKQETEKAAADIAAWIQGAEQFAVNTDNIWEEIKNLDTERIETQTTITAIIEEGKKARLKLDEAKSWQAINNTEIKRKAEADAQTFANEMEIDKKKNNISELETIVISLDSNRKKLAAIEKRDEILAENEKWKNIYDAKVNRYNKELTEEQSKATKERDRIISAYTKAKSQYESQVARLKSIAENAAAEEARCSISCVNCGYIAPDAKKQAEIARTKKEKATQELVELSEPIVPDVPGIPKTLKCDKPIQPKYVDVPKVDGNKRSLLADIEYAVSAIATIAALKKDVARLEIENDKLEKQTYNIDDTIDAKVTILEKEHTELQEKYTDAKTGLAKLETAIKEREEVIKKAEKTKIEIATAKTRMADAMHDLEDWQYIAKMLQPAKIPAMELDIILGDIDEEATRNLSTYLDGKLSFRTETQKEGKVGTVDKFDIRIYDSETGGEKSFVEFSPGVKAFLNDAYIKSLIKKRNERAQRHYSPIISDEADGPVQPERVAAYYEMQNRYFTGTKDKVIIVSHAPDAHSYVQNRIVMEDIRK